MIPSKHSINFEGQLSSYSKAILFRFAMELMNSASRAVFIELESLGMFSLILCCRVCSLFAFGAGESDNYARF
jgi:hypothetical protein